MEQSTEQSAEAGGATTIGDLIYALLHASPQQLIALSLAVGLAAIFCAAAAFLHFFGTAGGTPDPTKTSEAQSNSRRYHRLEEGDAAPSSAEHAKQPAAPRLAAEGAPAAQAAVPAGRAAAPAAARAAAPAAPAAPAAAPSDANPAQASSAAGGPSGTVPRSSANLARAASPPAARAASPPPVSAPSAEGASRHASPPSASAPLALSSGPTKARAAAAPSAAPPAIAPHASPADDPSAAKEATSRTATPRSAASRLKEYSRGKSSARGDGAARGSRSPAKPKTYAFNSPAVRRDETPAPGDYETDTHTLAVRALKTHNKAISSGRGTFMTKLNDDRSAPSLTEDGDPGAYSDYHLEKASLGACNSHISNKSVREGQIGFNSRVARCVDASFDDRSGARGPGHYDFHHMYGCGVSLKSPSKSGTSAFTNKAPLLGYLREIHTPGSGDYRPEPIERSSDSKLGSSAFAGNTARCAASLESTCGPGPETYEQDHRSLTRQLHDRLNPNLPPFGVSSRRI